VIDNTTGDSVFDQTLKQALRHPSPSKSQCLEIKPDEEIAEVLEQSLDFSAGGSSKVQ
jgi:hypothetical protein